MNDQDKTKEELLGEVAALRQRVAAVEASLADRQRESALLQQTEARWRSAVANAPTFIAIVDSNGTIQFLNHAQPGLSVEDAIGKTTYDFVRPKYHNIVRKHLQHVFQTGETRFFESVGAGPDGQDAWYETYLGPVKMGGQVVAATMTAIEITERKQAEAKLLQERNRAQEYLDVAAVIIVVLDNDGKISLLNQKGYELLGYQEGDLFGQDWFGTCVPERMRDGVLATFRQLMAGQLEPAEYYENAVVTRSGEERIVAWHNALLTDDTGRITGTLSSGTDITEQKRAEEALRTSEERYRTLAESATDVVYIVDKDGKLLYANQSAAAYMGLTPSALVGKRQQDLFPPTVAKLHIERLRRVFTTGEVGENDELFHFGSEEVWLNIRSIPIRDGQGRITSVMGVCRNITDRKRAEEALKKAHDELEQQVQVRTAELARANKELTVFRTLADASSQGFGIADLDGRITYANIALRRLIGPGDPLGQSVLTQVPEEHRRQLQEEGLPAVLRDGRWESEWTSRRESGERVVTLNSVFLLRDEAGCPAYIADVVTDITERKKAEDALRQAHDELRAIYDGMVDGLLIADTETKQFVRANASICGMLGYSEAELLSRSVMDIHPANDLPAVVETFQAQAEGRLHVGVDMPVLRRDGGTFFADIATNTIDYKGRPCLIGFFRDVTERKQAQEALRKSEDKYRSLVEACPDAVVMSDLSGRVLFASPQTWALLGLSASEELLGKSVFDYVTEGDRRRLAANMSQVSEVGSRRNTEYTALRRDGTTVPAEASSVVIRGGEGQPKALMAVIRDITERKRAEEVLEKERRNLKYLLQSSDHERQLIAYEIHDGLAQQLAGALMQFETFAHRKDAQAKQAEEAFHAGVTMLRQSHFEARRLIAGVRPPILDESGVVEAIAHLVHEQGRCTGQKIDSRSRVDFDRLAPTLENAIYRIAPAL